MILDPQEIQSLQELHYAVEITSNPKGKSKIWYVVCDDNEENWHVADAHNLIPAKEYKQKIAELTAFFKCPVNVIGMAPRLTENEVGFKYVAENDRRITYQQLERLKNRDAYVTILDQCYYHAKSEDKPEEYLEEITNTQINVMSWPIEKYDDYIEDIISNRLMPEIYPVIESREQAEKKAKGLIDSLNNKDHEQPGRTPDEKLDDALEAYAEIVEYRDNSAKELASRIYMNKLLLKYIFD